MKGERREMKETEDVVKQIDLTRKTDLLKRNFKINGNCTGFL